MNRFRGRALFLLLAVLLCGAPLWAQPSSEPTLRVATRQVPPFVVKKSGQPLTGFSIELWQAIASELKVNTKFVEQPGSVSQILDAVRTGRTDLGVAAISITAERDQEFDFSQPIYSSGLQIMVPGQPGAPNLWDGFMQVMTSPVLRQFVIIAVILVILPAHLLWWLERRHPEGIIRGRGYLPGIFEAAWWTVSCLATQAEEMPKHTLSRILAVVWMFFAVIFIAFVTAALTANMTLQQLRSDIHSPEDLPGKRVATVTGSTSQSYMNEAQVRATAYRSIDAAFAALEKGDVDALVYDAPVLQYYAANAGNGHVSVTGAVFRKEDYGILLPAGSRWRKPVNVALLRLKENGEYDRIYERWFGDNAS